MPQVELEFRGPLEENVNDFLSRCRKEASVSNMKHQLNMTIYPQGSLDIRIKFRDDQPYIVFKKTTQSEDACASEKMEVDKPITIEEVYRVIDLYKLIDVEEAVVSGVENYHFQIGEFDFSIKIGAEIGNFWEIDTVYDEETKDEDKAVVRNQMLDIIQKLGLTTWTQEEFKRANRNSRHSRITVAYSHENEWEDLIAHIDSHLKSSAQG